MGLAERKAVQTLKDGDFKQFVEQVKSICGSELPIEMDWASLENDDKCASFVDEKKPQQWMFAQVQNALTHICSDDMGKSAVKEKLKKIVLINDSAGVGFQDGTFTLRASLKGNGYYDGDYIRKFIEQQL